MDPIGISGLIVGIVALYSACRDCYIFFTTVKSAEKESLIHLRELDIQQAILKAWGFYWEIQRHDVVISEDSTAMTKEDRKLRRFLERNIYKANGVVNALCAISDTLSNRDKLMKRYGLNIKQVKGHDAKTTEEDARELAADGSAPSTIQNATIIVRQRLSIITKCRWAIKDRDEFKSLISDLKSYNDALYRLCPDGAFEAMNIHLTLDFLSQQESFIGLRRTLKLANQLVEGNEMSPSRGGLKMLASAAEFKAKVVKLRTPWPLGETKEMVGMVDRKQLKYLSNNLALLDKKVVYVERRSYRAMITSPVNQTRRDRRSPMSPPLNDEGSDHGEVDTLDAESESSDWRYRDIIADLDMRESILKLCYTLRTVDSWKNFLSLKPIRVVDYVRGRNKYQISLIYELPGNLGTPTRSYPAEDIQLRAPRPLSLFDSLSAESDFSLGVRFELAKKVFGAVVFLHASGWVHKNIRSSSIMFFPKIGSDGRTIDPKEPYLARYNFSRPDDVNEADYDRNFEDGLDNVPILAGGSPRSWEISLDYYHHPDKRSSPKRLYRHAYDVYSLGIVLLEIGFWSRIGDLRPKTKQRREQRVPDDPYEFRRYIIAEYLYGLRFACGDVYANVVHKCLMVDASDSEIGKASQRELCARIAADLSECRA